MCDRDLKFKPDFTASLQIDLVQFVNMTQVMERESCASVAT